MKKRAIKLLLLSMGVLFLLSGCSFGNDLYALPQLPEDYVELQSKILEVMTELDAEYAAPTGGDHTSTVQLQDLDGDGVQESTVAFLQASATTDQPLKICIFRQDKSGQYYVACMIEGDGTSINSVAYEDVNGDGIKEIIVSWQMSAKVHTLSVYQLGDGEATELMHAAYNERYALVDLDRDNQKELVVIQSDNTGESSDRAEYYDYAEGNMVLSATTSLSIGITEISTVTTGFLRDNVPAVYVTSQCSGGEVTDILALQQGVFANITRDPTTYVSNMTLRSYTDVKCSDISGDAVMDIPAPTALPIPDPNGSQTWIINWRQFDVYGQAYAVCTSYHSVADGWYLIIPSDWEDRITVVRDDTESVRGERSVKFCLLSGTPGENTFLTVSKLTGSNRATRAKLGNRFILMQTNDTIYTASLDTLVWDCGMTQEQLTENFHLIRNEWSSQ